MNQLIKAIRKFNSERDWEKFHSPKNLVMAVQAEASEIAEHFLWLTEKESRKLPAKKIAEIKDEVGDVMICLVNLADKLGIDAIAAAKDKLKKNRAKYPIGKAKGNAIKYSEHDKFLIDD